MNQAGGPLRPELSEAEAEDRLCVICLVNERDTTVLPCRHMCMCHECAQVRIHLLLCSALPDASADHGGTWILPNPGSLSP